MCCNGGGFCFFLVDEGSLVADTARVLLVIMVRGRSGMMLLVTVVTVRMLWDFDFIKDAVKASRTRRGRWSRNTLLVLVVNVSMRSSSILVMVRASVIRSSIMVVTTVIVLAVTMVLFVIMVIWLMMRMTAMMMMIVMTIIMVVSMLMPRMMLVLFVKDFTRISLGGFGRRIVTSSTAWASDGRRGDRDLIGAVKLFALRLAGGKRRYRSKGPRFQASLGRNRSRSRLLLVVLNGHATLR